MEIGTYLSCSPSYSQHLVQCLVQIKILCEMFGEPINEWIRSLLIGNLGITFKINDLHISTALSTQHQWKQLPSKVLIK